MKTEFGEVNFCMRISQRARFIQAEGKNSRREPLFVGIAGE